MDNDRGDDTRHTGSGGFDPTATRRVSPPTYSALTPEMRREMEQLFDDRLQERIDAEVEGRVRQKFDDHFGEMQRQIRYLWVACVVLAVALISVVGWNWGDGGRLKKAERRTADLENSTSNLATVSNSLTDWVGKLNRFTRDTLQDRVTHVEKLDREMRRTYVEARQVLDDTYNRPATEDSVVPEAVQTRLDEMRAEFQHGIAEARQSAAGDSLTEAHDQAHKRMNARIDQLGQQVHDIPGSIRIDLDKRLKRQTIWNIVGNVAGAAGGGALGGTLAR